MAKMQGREKFSQMNLKSSLQTGAKLLSTRYVKRANYGITLLLFKNNMGNLCVSRIG